MSLSIILQYSNCLNGLISENKLWRLQSSFEKVINIIDDRKNIITLHLNEIPKVPMSIVVDSIPEISGEVHLNQLLINKNSIPWNPLVPTLKITNKESIISKLKILQEWIYSQDKKGMLNLIDETSLGKQVIENIELLIEGWKNDSLIDYDKTCRGIMGFGSGLTPSSDDVICGVLAALYCTIPYHGKTKFTKDFTYNMISCGFKYTSTLSANFIKYYSMGYASELIVDLIGALYTGSNQEWMNQIKTVDSWGGSSGRDILFGFSLGYEKIFQYD